MHIEELLQDIAELYNLNSVGGALHIVLDDGNLDDESIQFCLDTCEEHWSVRECSSILYLTKSIGKRLLELTEEERRQIYDLISTSPSFFL
jgi:hypothetical protein